MSNLPRHAPPSGKRQQNQELLYDPDVAKASHAEMARTLAEKMPTGTLCTLAVDPAGYPYGSFVTYTIHEGDPVFLISALAEHTKNLQQNRQASLLVAEATGEGNPLALARVTLLGECSPVPDADRDSVKESFLEKHPTAEFYADFKDFSFWKLKVASLRYIGGFGRMSWVESAEWVAAEPDPLVDSAQGIIDHMNCDHADTMVLYCKTMSKAVDTTAAEMVALDRYGFEMLATTAEGPRPIRLAFSKTVSNVEQVRQEMVAMAHKVRDVQD
jgi:putative heme iron utilization protein